MPDFAYQALDRAGSTSSGTVQAETLEAAADRVRQLGLFPMAVNPASERGSERGSEKAAPVGGAATRHRVSRMDIVMFTRQLADLVGAGLPLDRVLTVLIRQANSQGL